MQLNGRVVESIRCLASLRPLMCGAFVFRNMARAPKDVLELWEVVHHNHTVIKCAMQVHCSANALEGSRRALRKCTVMPTPVPTVVLEGALRGARKVTRPPSDP